MATESHLKGSRGSHNRTRKDARANGVKKMSQSKFDKEVTELKKRLSKVTKLLHEEATEGQCYEWKLKRRVQWPVKRLCARNLKNKISVWVKKEEILRVVEHEEEVHMMCESEQGVYLKEEKEDADTGFADKLMNKENSSYPYEKEEGDADVRYLEDLKDCFAETNEYGMLEGKELV